ncbi:transmembrane protein, putative [Bodo saltans]|uniref:Transmembrane protein, putative n=1 Tax=Bodo saltans TaxID=75058 RepID=A0A0S4IXK0_BODSA|nr:transmembrane protein, putative [Bodo saltans]|eukprot:CUG08412.1 transmembrane protein, putative [Bodo saltans]
MKKASTNHDDSAAATCARRPQGKGVATMSSISCSNNNTCKLTLVALLRPCPSRSSGSFLASLIVVMVSLLLVTPHPLIHATVLTKTPTRTEGTVSGTNSVSASSLSPSFSPSGSASSSMSSTFSVTSSSTVSQSSSEDVSLSKGSGSATSSNTATQTLSSSSSNSEERWSLSRTRRSATPSSSARATRFTIEATVTHLSPSSSQSHSDSIGSASVSSITTSTSVTPSRSAHDLPPWLVGIDGDDLAALPKTILLTSSSPAHFVLRGDDSNGQMTTGAPTLTLRPIPVATNASGWTQQCREGYAPITGTLSTWNDVSIVYTDLVASLTSSGVASSSITGHITSYLVCTSDGYFSGIVVTVFGDESLSSTTVTFDDGAALPSDGSVSLPATAGQFPSWSIGLMVTLTSSTSVLFSQSVLASFQVTTSPVVYVADASSTCAEDNSLSSFATTTSMNTNNSVLVVSFVIQSSDVEGISAAVSSLQLCVLGSSFLNTTIALWRDVDVNGALVSSASPLRIVAAVASIVSPLQISTSSVNVDASTDALVYCNSLGGTYRNLSLSTMDTPTTAVQTFSMTLPSNVSSGQELSLCLNSPRVPALQGTLVVAIAVIISVTVVDGVSSPAATFSALSPVALFVGSSAPSGISWAWAFPTTLAIGTFTDITNNMELFIGLRSTNATTTVSPLSSTTSRSSLSATATNTSSAFWVTPADWSSLVDSSGVLAQGAQLLLCWYTAVGSTLVTPIQVALLTFDVTLVRVDSIGTVASPSSTMVAVSGTTNNTVRVSIMSLGTTVPGTNTTSESNGGYRIGTLSSDSATCTPLNTSASYIGTSGAMSGVGSALLLTRLVFSASGTSTGVFCIQRSTTQRSFARTGVFTVVTLASFGNSTNIPQLMEIASGHTSTDRIGATRRYPITLTNMVASVGSDIVTAVTVLPCNSTLQAMIATTLVVDSSDLTTVWLDVAWQSGPVPSTAPSTIALCGWSASASTLEFPSLGVVVRVVPRVVTTSGNTILLAGAITAQRFLINFAATRTLSSGLVWVMMPVSSTTATCSGTTTVRFASTLGGFIANTSSNSTSLSAAMLTSGITGLEPTSSICMGLVNVSSISTSSTTVYVRLPFQAATIVLARYELSGPVNANVSLFPSATPSTSTSSNTVYLYDYELPTLAVQLNMTNASVVTTSSGNSGLTLSLAVSSASSCTSATPIAAWSQGTGSAVDSLPLNISQVLGDIFFLCAKLNTNANPSNTSTYVWTKYYAQVLRMSLLESTMSPVSYATAAELLTVPTSSMASIATMAASARTMTIQGQNLDIPDTMTMNLFIDAGADCLNDVPDLVAPSSATPTTTTRAVFTAPAVSTPLQYLTMCVVMGLHTHPMPVYLGATLRVTGFASIGLPADAVTSRQQGIVAISNFVLNLTVYGPTGSAPLDTSTFQLLASNTSSCGRGITESDVYASFIALPMTTSSSGVTQISMTGLSTAGTYYLCYADASEVFSSTRRTLLELSEWRGAFYNNPRRQSHRRMQTSSSGVASPVGLTITSIDLRISTHTLGTNKSIGSLVNSTLSVPATGSLLSNALLYISATDQTSCTSTLTGTTAYGNSRVPVVFSGCSGSAASATLPAASVVTGSDPMKLCIGIASALDASIVSSSTLTFFDSGLLLAVVEPDALSVSQNQSDSVTYLGTLSTQPIVGMLDGNSGVALSVIPTSTVLQAEWYSVSPVVEATGEVYTLTSSEGDTNFDFSTAPTPVQLRTGKFGYEYMLHFSVPTAASSIAFTPVNSSNTSLDSCTSDLQWAVWYTTTCTTCPTNAYCDGTPVFRVAGSYWRYSEYSPNLYSCGSPYMEDTCTSNTTTGTCVTGHMGPRCSVCEEGYGLGSGYCQECSGNEVLNGFIVFFAALAICIVIVVLVISTLQCKKSDQFPIYFKLLLNHLTQASTLGQFSENLSSALTTLFKIQRQVSRPSPAFAALTCTFGTDWYGQFIMVIAFPGVIAALLIIFFTVKQIVSDYGERRRLGLSTTVTREGFRKSIATDEGSTKHRRKTVMFFAPKHSIDESLDIDGVEKTNSIAIMDLSNDNALLKSQISSDGRPPLLIRRKKRAQSATEGDQSGNTPGVDDAHQPRESPPSVPLAPLDPPREAMEGEDADEERKTVMFFAPKHSIDESLDIEGVEKTNSIAIMDLSNDNALLKSQISNDGRPPLLIRRKKRAQSATEGDQSGNTPGVDDAHQPRESPPRKTVMFFAPKHSIDESLDIEGVEKTNSIAIMDLSNDNALLKSQISNDGRPPLLIRRKKRAQSATEGDQSGNTPGVDDAHQPRESPPSVPLAPLDPPREAMEGEDADEERPARHQQPTPTAFALDDDDADISGSNVQRKSSSRGTQLTQQSAQRCRHAGDQR